MVSGMKFYFFNRWFSCMPCHQTDMLPALLLHGGDHTTLRPGLPLKF